MKDYLKNYRVIIHTLSPIYVGSGEKIPKKEYIYLSHDHKVIIPDIQKMYSDVKRRGLEKEFTNFIMDLSGKSPSLFQWLDEHEFSIGDYKNWQKYELDAGEAFESQSARPKEIEAFVKDGYGNPYIPGSSVKGMFRTALLTWEVQKNPQKYEEIKNKIKMAASKKERRDRYLAKEISLLEQQVFYTLRRDEQKRSNAVNDVLSGLHVGDSMPIAVEKLTLSQKIDYTLAKEEKPLPLLRESVMPKTDICIPVTIDTTLCPYSMQDIEEALNCFGQICYKYFYSRFGRGSKEKNIVWLGGGCGFLSKTVLYPLFGTKAVGIVDKVYRNTLGRNYFVHKHMKDVELQVTPHVCKCTRYRGELYDMGMGQIAFEKV